MVLCQGSGKLAVAVESRCQQTQAIDIRRCGANLDRLTVAAEQVEVETPAAEIQTGVQQRNGPLVKGPLTWSSGGASSIVFTPSIPIGRAASRWACTTGTRFRSSLEPEPESLTVSTDLRIVDLLFDFDDAWKVVRVEFDPDGEICLVQRGWRDQKVSQGGSFLDLDVSISPVLMSRG
jgi:hypothetical protein